MNKVFLCPGGGFEQLNAVEGALQNGYQVIVVDPDLNSPSGNLSGVRKAQLEITDLQNIERTIVSENVDAILPVPLGRSLNGMAELNSKLNLPGVTIEAAQHCTDKLLFSTVMAELEIPHPETCLLKSIEVEKMDSLHGRILKPRFGSGGRGVQVIQEGLRSLRQSFDEDNYLIQERIGGIEFGIDGLFLEGKTRILQVRRKYARRQTPTQLPNLELYESLVEPDAGMVRQLQEGFDRFRGKFSLACTPFHADVVVSEKSGDPVVIEMSPRPSGLGLSSHLMRRSRGRDMLAEYFAAFEGEEFRHRTPQRGEFCWNGDESLCRKVKSTNQCSNVEIYKMAESGAGEDRVSVFFTCQRREELFKQFDR